MQEGHSLYNGARKHGIKVFIGGNFFFFFFSSQKYTGTGLLNKGRIGKKITQNKQALLAAMGSSWTCSFYTKSRQKLLTWLYRRGEQQSCHLRHEAEPAA